MGSVIGDVALDEAKSEADVIRVGGEAMRKALDHIEAAIAMVDMTPANKAKLMRKLDKLASNFIGELQREWHSSSR